MVAAASPASAKQCDQYSDRTNGTEHSQNEFALLDFHAHPLRTSAYPRSLAIASIRLRMF